MTQNLKTVSTTLTALVGVAAAIPGVLAITKGFGSPPGSHDMFGVALEIVVAGAMAAVILPRRPRTRPGPFVGTVTALALVTLYYIAFDAAVEKHHYYPDRDAAIVVPFLTPKWAPPELDTLVACTKRPRNCPSVLADYGAPDVAAAVTRYGPDEILPLIPAWQRRWTIIALFALYAGCIAMLALTFGSLARRIAH
jgi:hypothetical protein